MSKNQKDKTDNLKKNEDALKDIPKKEDVPSLKGPLSELESKAKLADEYLDQLQRLQAEYSNYRKRILKEKEEYKKYVLEGFIYELLNIIDNFQRAISASNEKHTFEALLEGVNIVEKQILELLKTQGVISLVINPGDKFDPHVHHAVSHEPSSQYPVDTITQVLQPGYKIGDRILRPAMVIVSSGGNSGINETKKV